MNKGNRYSKVVITIALSLLEGKKEQFITISSIQDHSFRLNCISLPSVLERQRYEDVAYVNENDKREVWEEKSGSLEKSMASKSDRKLTLFMHCLWLCFLFLR